MENRQVTLTSNGFVKDTCRKAVKNIENLSNKDLAVYLSHSLSLCRSLRSCSVILADNLQSRQAQIYLEARHVSDAQNF